MSLCAVLIGCTAQAPKVIRYDVAAPNEFTPGPPSGQVHAATPLPNGMHAPFAGQPVAGLSGGFLEGQFLLTVTDNGYGLRANSADFFPRLVWWRFSDSGTAPSIARVVYLSDPQGVLSLAPRPNEVEGITRALSGSDIDPESIAPGLENTYWIGDEFGPFLFHFSASGELLEPPLEIPIPIGLSPYARGQNVFVSPDHPQVVHLGESSLESANLPRSKGIEGLSRIPGEDALVILIEGPLLDQPDQRLLPLLRFNMRTRQFHLMGYYPMDRPHQREAVPARHKIGDVLALSPQCFLVLETDDGHGVVPNREPRFKRIMRTWYDGATEGSVLPTETVIDLLQLSENEYGLASFPFVTIEGLAQAGENRLVIFNDDNFPDTGGRSLLEPDRTEFLWLELPPSNFCSELMR